MVLAVLARAILQKILQKKITNHISLPAEKDKPQYQKRTIQNPYPNSRRNRRDFTQNRTYSKLFFAGHTSSTFYAYITIGGEKYVKF